MTTRPDLTDSACCDHNRPAASLRLDDGYRFRAGGLFYHGRLLGWPLTIAQAAAMMERHKLERAAAILRGEES